MNTEKFLLVLFGWLLGLLGPALVDWFRQVREDDRCRAAIKRELITLGYRLTLAVHDLDLRALSVSNEQLQWASQKMKRFALNRPDLKVLESADMIQTQEGPVRMQMVATFHAPGKVPGLTKYSVASLDARVSSIHTFKNEEQIQLLEIKTQLDFLDETVDRTRKLQDMSFSITDHVNHGKIIEDYDNGIDAYHRRAKQIVERILQFIDGKP